MFLLDTRAADVGIPASALIDDEYGARQAAFRRKVQDSELTTHPFASPAELGQLVERSLRELANARRRIASRIRREQILEQPQQTGVLCAVISSTVLDLPAHRQVALDACLRQEFMPKMMEPQALSTADLARLSRKLVDQADVYILILGYRYGEVPVGHDKSLTHLELDRANERGIPKLVLLMADDHPLKSSDVDVGPNAERVNELREQLRREQAVTFFSSPDQLRALLIDGLSHIRNLIRSRDTSFHRTPAQNESKSADVEITTASAQASTRQIFLSYRHEETDWQASWLAQTLADRFGADLIFKDVDAIEPGDDFVEAINDAVGACDVLLALIGKEWLTITDENGQRRLDNPQDFVRLEIEAALKRKVRVIPILIEGARIPRADQLPSSLAELTRRQALELTARRFRVDTGPLLRVLERILVR